MHEAGPLAGPTKWSCVGAPNKLQWDWAPGTARLQAASKTTTSVPNRMPIKGSSSSVRPALTKRFSVKARRSRALAPGRRRRISLHDDAPRGVGHRLGVRRERVPEDLDLVPHALELLRDLLDEPLVLHLQPVHPQRDE